MPKFHDKFSLSLGGVVGGLVASSSVVAFGSGYWWVGLFQIAVGAVLSLHCLDMLKYYQDHRIIKIIKTETERHIYQEEDNRLS